MGGQGHAAARFFVFLCLLLASPSLARDIREKLKDGGGDAPPKDTGDIELQGSSILVTTNSEGVTEVYVGKPNITITDILEFITSTMNPFSRPRRSLSPVPLVTALVPTHYYPFAPSPSPYASLNLASDSMVLVAPIEADLGKAEEGEEAIRMDYAAYILPKGLSSLPRDMSKRLFTAGEGMKKIGLLMFPPDVDQMGATGRQPSNGLFPLDAVKIKEIKVVDGDGETTKLDAVLDSFGFARPGYSGSPWLILRDVAVKKEAPNPEWRDAGAEAAEKPAAAAAVEGTVSATDPVKEFGTIYINKDGVLTWHVSNAGQATSIPYVPFTQPFPFPVIPPIPFPWFNPNPFYLPFNMPPMPFWNMNHPSPHMVSVSLR